MRTLRSVLGALVVIALAGGDARAASRACGIFPSSVVGKTLLAVDVASGKSATADITAGNTCIGLTGSAVKLYVKGATKVENAVVAARKARRGTALSQVVTTFQGNRTFKLGKLTQSGVLLVSTKAYKKFADKSSLSSAGTLSTALAASGQASSAAGSKRLPKPHAAVADVAADEDADKDGLVDAVDADNDDDGILDNYDSSGNDLGGGPSSPGAAKSFNVFSNLKVDIDQTLNVNVGPVSTAQIDDLLKTHQTLAIGVAGDSNAGETTELDCGALTYCSAGGTGIAMQGFGPFPGDPGGANDPDSDGLGTITKGSTGDFQLQTGATSGDIHGGDTFIERVTDSTSKETEVPGMLNFVFNTTPALKTVTTDVASSDVDYNVQPRKGSRQNCFSVPATGPVTVTMTGWRPQRPGNSEVGEGEWVDIGHSKITIDIPNGACGSPNGPCAPQGPGNCQPSAYSTTDPKLAVGSDTLNDNQDDQNSDPLNTFTFTIDLSSCLSSHSVSWSSGETLFTDLQFRSNYGDNAAQKVCFTRQ